jgi:5-methylcytosine-specific restriction endonuclease McrA
MEGKEGSNMTDLIAEESEQDRVQAERHARPSRSELVLALIERDGDECRYCHRDFRQRERTIDHVYPQSRGYAEGWTYEQVWDLSNLSLACKPCNAKKGDQLLDEDGNIPKRKERTFRYRRDKRATRPDQPCVECDNGHNLFIDEICAQCGVSAQQFPRDAKVKAPDCDHAKTWCWACSIGIVERAGALEMLFLGVEGQEDGLLD